MMKEAKEHEAEDRKRKEEIEARNYADSVAYTAEKTLRDLGDKVPSDVRSEVEAKVKEVREAMQGKDIPLIRRKTEELGQVLQKIGASMYEAAEGPTSPPEGEQKPPEDEGTVEGEFKEV